MIYFCKIITIIKQKKVGVNLKVGYVRCSTIEQNEARQLKMMEEQNVEKLFVDKSSGKNTNRQRFKEMMLFVREKDIVIVESISV